MRLRGSPLVKDSPSTLRMSRLKFVIVSAPSDASSLRCVREMEYRRMGSGSQASKWRVWCPQPPSIMPSATSKPRSSGGRAERASVESSSERTHAKCHRAARRPPYAPAAPLEEVASESNEAGNPVALAAPSFSTLPRAPPPAMTPPKVANTRPSGCATRSRWQPGGRDWSVTALTASDSTAPAEDSTPVEEPLSAPRLATGALAEAEAGGTGWLPAPALAPLLACSGAGLVVAVTV
mmetsp:Transcript_35439/g.98040  ORF Transcript_35439/g.98040 Transcript_35439/m.98040 type:complete len:237 (-) Transcript_35439:1264-1974(-)